MAAEGAAPAAVDAEGLEGLEALLPPCEGHQGEVLPAGTRAVIGTIHWGGVALGMLLAVPINLLTAWVAVKWWERRWTRRS